MWLYISGYYFTDTSYKSITPTIILVRVSMGLSFHDESSMLEASIGRLRAVPDDSDSGIQFINDDSGIQMVERWTLCK